MSSSDDSKKAEKYVIYDPEADAQDAKDVWAGRNYDWHGSLSEVEFFNTIEEAQERYKLAILFFPPLVILTKEEAENVEFISTL